MLSLVSRIPTGLNSTLCQFNWTFAMASSDCIYSAKVSICVYFECYRPNQIFSSSCEWSTVIRKKRHKSKPFLILGAKPTVFTLEKSGVDFVPTQQHTQRSPQSSGTRLSQFTVCAECKASPAQGMSFLLSWTLPAVSRGKRARIVFHCSPQETWYHSQTKAGKLTDLLRWVWLQHTPRWSAPVEKAVTGSSSVLSCLHCPCL